MNIHDIYRPFLKYFRKKRMRRFQQQFGVTPLTRVLDVGGGSFNWLLLNYLPQLTILNISISEEMHGPYTSVVADGRYLPFKDKSFDIVYSNSVIEHLQNRENQQRFASECQRVGVRLYLQTPNKRFPIEPHLLTPVIHWLPLSLQKRLVRNFTVWGIIARPTQEVCLIFLKEVRFLNEKEFRQLFPEAIIWHERFLGLTKSFIAVKNIN